MMKNALDLINNIQPECPLVIKHQSLNTKLPFIQITNEQGKSVFLPLPFQSKCLKMIRGFVNPSPFAKNNVTTMDEKVRKSMEIKPNQITIYNDGLKNITNALTEKITFAFNVKCKVELYKLLIYESGGHFDWHQDSQKVPGMFATAVVELPSVGEGGFIEVKDKLNNEKVQIINQPGLDLSFCVFYSELFHRVTHVTSGARSCLIFNVITDNDGYSYNNPYNSSFHSWPNLIEWKQKFHDELNYICTKRKDSICYALEHEYSLEDLQQGNLIKPLDATIVHLIRMSIREGKKYNLYFILIQGSREYIYSGCTTIYDLETKSICLENNIDIHDKTNNDHKSDDNSSDSSDHSSDSEHCYEECSDKRKFKQLQKCCVNSDKLHGKFTKERGYTGNEYVSESFRYHNVVLYIALNKNGIWND